MKKTLALTGLITFLILPMLASCGGTRTVDSGRIVFTVTANDTRERYICSANASGGNITRLARSVHVEQFDTLWSDTGQLVCIEGGYYDPADVLSITDVYGENRRELLDISGIKVNRFLISPDGSWILLNCRAAKTLEKPEGIRPEDMGYDPAFYRLDCETGTLTKLVELPDIYIVNAAFSPDGKKIAIIGRISTPGTRWDIYIMNADGTGLQKMTDHDGGIDFHDRSLEWSADGKKLMYMMDNVQISDIRHWADIFVLDIRSGKETNLTNSYSNDDVEASWSPDGRKIVFTSGNLSDDNPYSACIMNADGSDMRKLEPPVSQPSWLPDGRRILAVHTCGYREFELVIYDTEAKTMESLLTCGESHEYGTLFYPLWIPEE